MLFFLYALFHVTVVVVVVATVVVTPTASLVNTIAEMRTKRMPENY